MPADPWPLCFACDEPAVWADQHGAGWCDAHTGRALSAVARARSVEDFDPGWRWERGQGDWRLDVGRPAAREDYGPGDSGGPT